MDSLFNFMGNDDGLFVFGENNNTQMGGSAIPNNIPVNAQPSVPFNNGYSQTTPYYNNVMPGNYQTPVNDSTADILGTVQQMCNQNNQFIMQVMNDSKKSQQEAHMLRMAMEKMKRERQEIPDEYTINHDGYGICHTSKGSNILIGKLHIYKIEIYSIEDNNKFSSNIYIHYIDSKNNEQHTIISAKNLSEKKLVGQFPGFEYICKNVKTADNFLAWYISTFIDITNTNFIPYHAGFTSCTENEIEKATFCCNDNSIPPVILQNCSENIREKTLFSDTKTIEELNIYAKKYLNTPKKVLLFVFSICGLFSTFLDDIGYPLTQILSISSPNSDVTRQACYYMKIFNRKSTPLSFNTNKTKIRKIFYNSKDETNIITDTNIAVDENRIADIILYINVLNSDSETPPHNTAIFSDFACCFLPSDKKISLSLENDFYIEMTQSEEFEMCYALNCITRYIIDIICNNYGKFKSSFTNIIKAVLHDEKCSHIPYMQSKTSFAVIKTVSLFISKHINLPVEISSVYDIIFNSLSISPTITHDCDDIVVNNFSDIINNCINSGTINIILHNKEMNFVSGEY